MDMHKQGCITGTHIVLLVLTLGLIASCLIPTPGYARLITESSTAPGFPSDAAFVTSVNVPLDASLPVNPGDQTFTITQNGVQFTFTTLGGAGLFDCAGRPRTPPCTVISIDAPITITINPPVPALGFVFNTADPSGTATFTGTTGTATFTTGVMNLFIGAVDIGDISSATLSGVAARWSAMRFVPPGGGPVNIPPVANAGPDQLAMLPIGATMVAVTLDGRGSSDPDGTIQLFQWSGTPDPDDVVMPMVLLEAGTHTFTLMVVDNAGASSPPDMVTVTVPGIRLTTPQDGDAVSGNAVAVAASIGTTVSVNSVLFQFRLAGSMAAFLDIGSDTATPFVVPWNTTPLADGAYELRAVGMLTTGVQTISTSITVTVSNAAPAASTIQENLGTNGILRKIQLLEAGVDNNLITSDGAQVTFPAAAVTMSQPYTVERRDPALAPGLVPGPACGPLTVLATAATFAAPLNLAIPYPDTNQDGIVDGTSFAERRLTLWVFNSQVGWIPISEAMIDPMANVMRATTSLPLPKQFGLFKSERPLIERGPQNPVEANATGTGTGLPVLQARIATGFEDVDVTGVTAAFEAITDNAADITQMRVTLVADANGNGQFDAGEVVLGREARNSFAASLTLNFTTPLRVPLTSQNHLLVLLDINTATGASTSGQRDALLTPVPSRYLAHAVWLAALPWGLGLVLLPRLRRQGRGHALVLLCILGCSCLLMATSCPSDESDMIELPPVPEPPTPPPSSPTPFVFDTVVHINDIVTQEITSGLRFTGPIDKDIRGASTEFQR